MCQVEQLEHTAEIGIRVFAPTVEALFACAAQGMFGLLEARPAAGSQPVEHEIAVDSMDMPSLMVDWLNELLYLHESTHLIFSEFKVGEFSETSLAAVARGYPAADLPGMHIKAVTYHQLQIVEDEAGWMAEIYFDI